MIQLTYPWALLALLSLPLIVFLHSLRPKRRRMVLPTTLLWREALQEQRRGFGLQKLLRDLSLLLLLLIALLVSVALSGPQWFTRATQQQDSMLILDISASMKARAGSAFNNQTRFAVARAQAGELINALPEDARMAIMTSGRQPVLRSAFESSKELLHSVLDQIIPTDESGRPAAALTLATALLQNREQGKIFFLSDKAFDDDLGFAAPLLEHRVVTDREEFRNVAITRFDFRSEIGTEERFQMLLSVRNYTDQAQNVPTEVVLDRNRLLAQTLEVPPDGEETIVLAFEGQPLGLAQAEIDFTDDLAVDNKAYAAMSVDEGFDVLILGRENFYLESVLSALPNVRFERLPELPSGDELIWQVRRNDVVILNGIDINDVDINGVDINGVDASVLPPGNYLLIDSIAAELPFSESGASVAGPIVSGKSASALVNGLDFSGIKIDRAKRIILDEDTAGIQRLFWSKETALALAWLHRDGRLVYLGFDLNRSNFALQTAFPLFIRQSLAWLRSSSTDAVTADNQLAAGEPFVIKVPRSQDRVIMVTPAGEGLIYQVEDGHLNFAATAQTGIYQYRVNDIERYFAVNLTDASESDIRPRAQLDEPPLVANQIPGDAQVVVALWPYFAIAALLLLLLEWGFWCMRRGSA